MLARTARVATTTARTSVLSNQAVAGRRFTAIDTRGGKSKLIYRFGMKDIPVELYPLGFVVGMGLIGGLAASARHFMIDGDLRLKRSGSA
ncbi:uncharacterized protein EHS24_007134 [Apiotrichum porosum]|uniref:Uncharacterized protein n=1 Tax=Apiotrichum porosum TaxID=105984 RepID=A0A427XX67_9TREE|nr:uncharacterized protein EHS24_007134 [Apiotrichum porosum]RSH83449.1 hypothetical protein EHS24_007134 [Apiotrichum porosum]